MASPKLLFTNKYFSVGLGAPTHSAQKAQVYLRADGSSIATMVYVNTDGGTTWSALSNTSIAAKVQTAAGAAYVIDALLSATGEALVKLGDNLANAWEFIEGTQSYQKFITSNGTEQVQFGVPVSYASTAQLIADVGTGAAIPVNRGNISMSITQNGAETNTLAIPSFVGQRLSLVVDVDTSGARVVTASQAINQAGNTIITMTDVNDFIELVGVKCAGGNLRWRVVVNDGCVLS